MRCPNCNFEINKKDTYCPHCGEEIRPLRNQVKNAWKDSKQRKGIKSFVKKNTLKKLVGVNLFIILSIFLIYIIDFILIYKLNIDTMSSFLTFITIILTFLLYVFGNIGILFIQIQLHAVLYDLGGVGGRLRAGEIYTKLLTNNIADHIVNLGFDVDIG